MCIYVYLYLFVKIQFRTIPRVQQSALARYKSTQEIKFHFNAFLVGKTFKIMQPPFNI